MKKSIDQWNKAAKKYTKDQEESAFVESNKRVVKTRFQDMSGQKVSDLGCGYGYYADYFQSIGADIIGVDGSFNMIDIARSRYKNCTFEIRKHKGMANSSYCQVCSGLSPPSYYACRAHTPHNSSQPSGWLLFL